LRELLRESHSPTSIIFQRIQAEEAFRERQWRKVRFQIADGVRTLWGARVFLVRISILGFALGVLTTFLIPTLYTSSTRLMPPDNAAESPLSMQLASVAASHGFGQMAPDIIGGKSTSDVFVGILSSRTLQNKIIEQFDLKRVYGSRQMEGARHVLASRVEISIDRKNQFITVSVTDSSPQRAADMAKAYVDQLNGLVSELSTSAARRERLFLESRLAQVNQDLETAEKDFSQFASKNSTIDIGVQGKAMVEAAATLQGQLMVARAELEGLRQIYSDSSVRVRAVQARIAELESQLQKFEGNNPTKTLNTENDAAASYPSIRKLPLLGVTYADLYRRTKVQEVVYEVLTQEYELAKVQEARQIPTVKVLDPADVPEKRSFPPRRLNIGITTMCVTGLFGVVFLFGSKIWHEGDPHDLGKAVITEIWIDLKAKRFLDPGNSHGTEGNGLPRNRGVLFLLGWRNPVRNSNGSNSSTNFPSKIEPCENSLPGSKAS
jgi:capsule polysaccharide export protein KpsE/RkpR